MAWGLGTVERRSTTDQVLHQLRAAILAGRIKPDEQLPEAALASKFGTGRSAIREALRQLVQEGLVVVELNRGARVRGLLSEDVVDVLRTRRAIECAAVAEILGAPDVVDLYPLVLAQERIRTAAAAQSTQTPSRDLIAADIDFHRQMVALTNSPRLCRAHEPLAAESQMLLNWHPVYAASDFVADHQKLLDALALGDPGTCDLVREHMELTVRLIAPEAMRYADRVAHAESLIDHSQNEGSSG